MARADRVIVYCKNATHSPTSDRTSCKCACAASLRASFYPIFFHVLLRMRQDDALLHAAMIARADTVVVCSLPLAKNAMHSPTSIYTSLMVTIVGERERSNLYRC